MRRFLNQPGRRVHSGLRRLARELVSFGLVGAVAFIVDTGVFNLLRYAGPRLLEDKPLTAKVIAVSVATLVAWLGHRYWTFHRRRRVAVRRELVLFAVMNVIGLVIALACLAFSHYVLGLTSPLADNVSANGVGLVLSTLFRFVAYRNWVFTEVRADESSADPTAQIVRAPRELVTDSR